MPYLPHNTHITPNVHASCHTRGLYSITCAELIARMYYIMIQTQIKQPSNLTDVIAYLILNSLEN